MKKTDIKNLVENELNEGDDITIEDLVDIKLESDRTDFAEPDRNEVDDVPDDNPEATLKDIEKEVTESFISVAKSIVNEDVDTAALNLVEFIEKKSSQVLSPGEKERMVVKYKKIISNI